MRSRTRGTTPAEYGLHPFDRWCNRSHPEARVSAALAAEKRTHVRQNNVSHVQYELEWTESENADGENPCEPFSATQIPQNLRNGFPSDLHRAIGHQDMNRRIGVPYIEFRIEQPEFIRIITN